MSDFKSKGEVEMDDRGRVSFGRVGIKGRARYLVEESDTGEIRLVPLISIPIRKAIPWTTTAEFQNSLDESLKQAKNGETVSYQDLENATRDEK